MAQVFEVVTNFIYFHQGDYDTCNVQLKIVNKHDIQEGIVTVFKKSTARMKELMYCMVEKSLVSISMSLDNMSYQDNISLVEQGMEILRNSAISNKNDTSKHRNFLGAPFVTFNERITAKTSHKRKVSTGDWSVF